MRLNFPEDFYLLIKFWVGEQTQKIGRKNRKQKKLKRIKPMLSKIYTYLVKYRILVNTNILNFYVKSVYF